MGHRINRTEHMFDEVNYNTKTTEELRIAMTAKVSNLKEKIVARETRMRKIREEYQLDAERLATLVMQFRDQKSFVSYEAQHLEEGQAPVPAGVIANLIREREMIDNERKQIKKLELVLRNLRDTEQFAVSGTGEIKTRPCVHRLDDEELEYLGF